VEKPPRLAATIGDRVDHRHVAADADGPRIARLDRREVTPQAVALARL